MYYNSRAKKEKMDSVIIRRQKNSLMKVSPVPVENVYISGFFEKYMEINRNKNIPQLFNLFEKYGTIDNFRICAGLKKGEITRRLATDSDLYKWMEAVAWDTQNKDNQENIDKLDELICLISKAQEKSGYIATYYTGAYKNLRLKNFENSHELYCGGHLIQSAIAHYRSTGKTNFIDIAIKWADYICKLYESKKIKETDGHPEVEMALVELYRTTGNKKYLNLAGILLSKPYVHLGNKSFLEFNEITGHAVRMMYLLSGATDYYAETRNPQYWEKIKCLFDDLKMHKYYVTGGIGARYQGETFGFKYELPNLMAYCETCASISLMMWLYRMFLIEPSSEYFDLFENTLYNAFLASVSLEGASYFYVNPLASLGNHERKQWYSTTCCPPNFQRFLAQLPGYFYAAGENEIWVNLYDSNCATIVLPDGNNININMKTDYPWNGKVLVEIIPEKNKMITIKFRIPHWSENTLIKIGKNQMKVDCGCYWKIDINKETCIEINFDVKSCFYSANPAIESCRNCLAIKKGPIVYCLESIDNNFDVFNFFYIPDQNLKENLSDILGGIITISGYGMLNKKRLPLYQAGFQNYDFVKTTFLAIPYYAWSNRGKSSMIVWVPVYFK